MSKLEDGRFSYGSGQNVPGVPDEQFVLVDGRPADGQVINRRMNNEEGARLMRERWQFLEGKGDVDAVLLPDTERLLTSKLRMLKLEKEWKDRLKLRTENLPEPEITGVSPNLLESDGR